MTRSASRSAPSARRSGKASRAPRTALATRAEPSRSLLLLRHAKAVPAGEPPDFDRPLSERGRRDAQAVGRQLHEWGLRPDLVLCSPSVRTRETWEHAAGDTLVATVGYPELIYSADRAALLGLVRDTPDDVRTLLLIGHGPGLPSLAEHLAGPGRLEHFATSGLARFELAGSWATAQPTTARLIAYVAPRG